MALSFWGLGRRVLGAAGILILFVLLPNPASANPGSMVTDRPKIGLALGGGAAAGFAHIGVLKWLEEHRVPVDYIAGTSMGGLIGGCYAMGMSPEEIRDLIRGIDWAQFFNPTPPYDDMDFRRKEDQRDYPMMLEFGWREGLRLPSGLPVYRVSLLLSRLALPYSLTRDFDKLPIPFRCVAVDLHRSDTVVLGSGSLAEAMRATMAIPGVFTPVQRNGQLLVDGGILNNVPVNVAQQMGSDTVVAVNLSPPLPERSVETIDSVLVGTIATVTEANSRPGRAAANIVLSPNLAGLGLTSWTECDRYIAAGYQAAAAQAERFRAYALNEEAWRDYLQRRADRRQPQRFIPTAVTVTGGTPAHQALIRKQLQDYIGEPLDTLRLEKDLTRIIGSGLYDSLRYEYELQNGAPVLAIRVFEKSYGPPFIDPSLPIYVDGFKAGHISINPAIRITSFDVAGEDSELRTDLAIGTDPYASLQLYKPFFNRKWFVTPTAFLEQTNDSLYDNGVRRSDYLSIRSGAQVDLGYSFNQFAAARVGYMIGTQGAALKVGQPLPPELDGTFRAARFKYSYHSADDDMFPIRGLDWDFQAWWYDMAPGAPEPFGKVENTVHWSIPAGRYDSFSILLANGFSLRRDLPLMQQFRLGGPFRLGTYNFAELHGNNYLLSHLGFIKHLGKPSFMGGDIYLGAWLEYGGVYHQWSEFQPACDLAVGFLSPTFLGPLYIGASLGPGANPFFTIMVGRMLNF